MEYAIIGLIVAVVSGGVFGGLAQAWSLRLALLAMNRRISLLEDFATSDKNREKAKARWNLPDLKKEVQPATVPPQPAAQWWEKQ